MEKSINQFKSATLKTLASLLFLVPMAALTFNCSSGGGGNDDPPPSSSSAKGTSSSGGGSSSSVSDGVAEAKTTLGAAISAATSAKEGAEVSANGADVFTSDSWVTSAQKATLEAAIAAAQTAKDKANATKAEVEAATSTLNAAIAAFNGAKQAGTHPLCGSSKYVIAAQFCHDNTSVHDKCGGETYAPATQYCFNNTIQEYLFDTRDNDKRYKTVVIGEQTWMAENLNYAADGSKCGNNAGAALSDANTAGCDTYGRLYDWATAMAGAASSSANPSGRQGVCPSGWHLPSDAEWTELFLYAGGTGEYGVEGAAAGAKLRAAEGWAVYDGTDDYGFAALPGGVGYDGYGVNLYYGLYNIAYGYWWSATESSASNAYHRVIYNNNSTSRYDGDKTTLLQRIRCVKD